MVDNLLSSLPTPYKELSQSPKFTLEIDYVDLKPTFQVLPVTILSKLSRGTPKFIKDRFKTTPNQTKPIQ